MKARTMIILLILIAFLGGVIFGIRRLWKTQSVRQAVTVQVAEHSGLGQESASILPLLLGIDKPRTYLVLFLNNTELRPGGGFIGTYAIVKAHSGTAESVKLGGTENVEKNNPALVTPPAPIAKYLKVQNWYFRDSNWSPDFAKASQEALTLFAREHDVPEGGFDGVIGVTPTVIEELLKITGPISVNGLELTADNVTEKMEYEVEYAYKDKGISFNERKLFLGAFGTSLIGRIKSGLLKNWSAYFVLIQRMVNERQVAAYLVDPALEARLETAGWSGTMSAKDTDYLLWADANLGALKTDAAVKRDLFYSLTPSSSGYIATALMQYRHEGHFDWRTTRYLDYVRVFAPLGSHLVGVTGAAKEQTGTLPTIPNQGTENGRQWFGAFITIDPGKTADLSFQYRLAPSVVTQIRNGSYTLTFDKQIGTPANGLTLALDFGRKVIKAEPGEVAEKFGDNRYDVVTDARVSRTFTVSLKP